MFSRMITNTHLKAHALTLKTYKKQFGVDSLVSDDYRQENSAKKSETTKQKIAEKVRQYAKLHPEEMHQRAMKAAETKRAKIKRLLIDTKITVIK